MNQVLHCGNDNNTSQDIPIILCFIHCITVFVTICFIMTCTLYTSQYRSRSNETSTCKYYLEGKSNQY